ncbi:hypothetical protein K491DRAFT_613322 [Lophiostoma macrostomum CBS 122681]|uniref:Thioredoxin domain-containing protein n=1 Tax=Lophiostoma macrostomum CBS 122681 TaxID=1314788 RepID=A0A6A6SMD3_9PLEO|nr:hypothetical protein K491DRAFT_613322 [Lophiostoma macrostomum CBS 122681]
MPVHHDLKADSPQDLPIPDTADAKIFVGFIASVDLATGLPWCPDVRAALPVLERVFGGEGETQSRLSLVDVGQKAEWKDLDNVYRKVWGIRGVPTVIIYERVGGEVKEVDRLTDPELFDEARVRRFVGGKAASL